MAVKGLLRLFTAFFFSHSSHSHFKWPAASCPRASVNLIPRAFTIDSTSTQHPHLEPQRESNSAESRIQMSLIGSYPCANITAPHYLSYSTATFECLLCLPSVFGNLLVVLAVYLDPNKNLRSPFNYFVANLAVADLIVGCIVEPLSIEYHISEVKNPSLLLHDHVRRVCAFISCTASVLFLAVLSLDRYIAISSPLAYRAKLTQPRAVFISLAIWVFSAGFPFLYFRVGYLNFSFVFINTSVVASFVVLVVTYVRMFKTLRAQVRQWDDLGQHGIENQLKKRAIKWEKKITKTLVVMLSLFMLCFFPSCVISYIIGFCGTCDCEFIHWLRDINYVLILANSSMNPFVFAWRLKTFRKAFARILTCGAFVRRVRYVSDMLRSGPRQYQTETSTTSL